jgi:hypothetical protein
MEKPTVSSHSSLEFRDWGEIGALVLTPKFQRREVWKTPARSYFIESIIRDIPIPPIFLRLRQDPERRRVIREVIDGQQRLRALLDFMADEYALSKTISGFGGKRFSQLPENIRTHIETFTFLCEVFQQIRDEDVLEVFARVNTHSVGLNDQELRNGRYFGHFKQSAFRLAHQHLEFWRQQGIFTESGIARMLEVELTSELMIAALAGQQDKKKSIDEFYARFDESFPERSRIEARFAGVIDALNAALADVLKESEFRRVPLFYTLFCVVLHRLYGLPGVASVSPASKRLSAADSSALRDAVIELSAKIRSAKEERKVSSSDLAFINACLRQTDNLKPRQKRFETLYSAAF